MSQLTKNLFQGFQLDNFYVLDNIHLLVLQTFHIICCRGNLKSSRILTYGEGSEFHQHANSKGRDHAQSLVPPMHNYDTSACLPSVKLVIF